MFFYVFSGETLAAKSEGRDGEAKDEAEDGGGAGGGGGTEASAASAVVASSELHALVAVMLASCL